MWYKTKKNFNSVRDVHQEIFPEIFIQLQSKLPLNFRHEIDNQNMYVTRRSSRGLLPITYSRTVTKSKSLKNARRKSYNWLTGLDLIPSNFNTFTDHQTKRYLNTICNLSIQDGRDLQTSSYNSKDGGTVSFSFSVELPKLINFYVLLVSLN